MGDSQAKKHKIFPPSQKPGSAQGGDQQLQPWQQQQQPWQQQQQALMA